MQILEKCKFYKKKSIIGFSWTMTIFILINDCYLLYYNGEIIYTFFFGCYQRQVCEISICECIKQLGIYSITYNVHLSVFLFSYQKGMGYPKNFVSKWKKIPVKKLSLPMSFYHTAINILMRILSGTRDQDSDKQNLLLSPPIPSYPLPFSYTTK